MSLRPSPQAVSHLEAALRGHRTSRSDQWHVTLAFLGEVAQPAVLHEPLRTAAAAHAPFELRLEGAGSFRGARVVWVGVGGDIGELSALARSVQQACRDAGVVLDDRPLRPHLSVGKVGRLAPEALRDYCGPSWRVSEVELVQSVLGKTAVHTVRETLPLYQA